MDFVNVWSKATGRKHSVPRHYLDNPFLMLPFRRTEPKGGAVVDETTPSDGWTIAQLRAHAKSNHVDLTGARSKPAILDRIRAAAAPHVDTMSSVPNTDAPEVSSDTVSGE